MHDFASGSEKFTSRRYTEFSVQGGEITFSKVINIVFRGLTDSKVYTNHHCWKSNARLEARAVTVFFIFKCLIAYMIGPVAEIECWSV